MAFYLRDRESVADGVKRIANEQAEKALFQLTVVIHPDPSEAVHDVRKRFKKIRALLRLVRDDIGEVYQRENECFRDMGRRLAEVRDAQVRSQTMDSLIQHFDEAIAPDAFTDIQQALAHYHQSTRRYLLKEEDAIAAVLPALEQARARIADWPLEESDQDWAALEDGLKRVYQRSYECMGKALAAPTVEHLHDWRKRAKYLRYHSQLLRRLWPDYMSDYEDYCHDLTDYLGDDHDLAMLKQFVLSDPDRIPEDETVEALLALINQRQQELRAAAVQLGQRLYAESPKAFMARFEAYWQIWRSDLPLQPKAL